MVSELAQGRFFSNVIITFFFFSFQALCYHTVGLAVLEAMILSRGTLSARVRVRVRRPPAPMPMPLKTPRLSRGTHGLPVGEDERQEMAEASELIPLPLNDHNLLASAALTVATNLLAMDPRPAADALSQVTGVPLDHIMRLARAVLTVIGMDI